MKIGFVVTNFNNSVYTINALRSISEFSNSCEVLVVVVDNCSVEEDLKNLKKSISDFPFAVLIEGRDNIGYFRGLNKGLDYIDSIDFQGDVVVVGNNDLTFPVDFLDKLNGLSEVVLSNPVISPDLVTLDGVHQNPHVVDQISLFRLFVWDIYYSSYFAALVIKFFARYTRRWTSRRDHERSDSAGFISEGYGACYLLTPLFFKEFKKLWAPTFLMGEEFFLKKQLESKNYSVYYEPSIVVYHHDHATLNKVPSKQLWSIAKDSHKIYKKFLRVKSLNLQVD